MKKKLTMALRVSSLGLTALLALLFTGSSAFGADRMKAEVPFAFHVGSKTLPAGAYQFKIDREADVVTVSSDQPRSSTDVLIVTSLAARPHSTGENHAHLVFDKVGNTYTLSELWEPGSDGVLVHATKGKHEHHVIHIKPLS